MNQILEKTIQLPFEEAVAKTRLALKDSGFGIITEINVTDVLKQKLDMDFKKYIILGACNPKLASQALAASDKVGLLLPCNVIVHDDNGGVKISTMLPSSLLGIIGESGAQEIANTADGLMQKAIDAI